jgi:hypothetical protein
MLNYQRVPEIDPLTQITIEVKDVRRSGFEVAMPHANVAFNMD